MSQSWSARYLDGVTAQPETVTVTPAAHGLEIRREDGSIQVWRYAELLQTQGDYEGEQVRLERRGKQQVEALVVSDVGFLSRLHKVAPRVSSRFHNPQARAHRPFWVATAFVAAVLLSAGVYVWGIPAAAAFVAERVPVSWEEELGQTVVESLRGSAPECDSAEVTSAIDDIVTRLAGAVPDNPYTFRVTVVKTDVMNAFAAPGGYVVIYSGLLRRTKSPEELAGVLAHEMSHVLHRHGTKSLFRDVSTSIFLSIIVGDAGGVMGTVLEGAKTLGNLRYSREAEEEADREGLSLLTAAGINPDGMIAFFKNLEKRIGSGPEFLEYLSSHPATRNRIVKLEGQPRPRQGSYVKLRGGKRWKSIAPACAVKDR